MQSNSQTNKLLGYPPDARLLILNTDDFGMCHSINEAVTQAIRHGAASSCTLMVPCPWGLHGMHLLRENPDISFGVHLTAVSEAVYYRWGPVAPKEKVPSLVDEAGYFYSEERIPAFLAQVNLAELEVEFRAQIEAVLAAGLKPTHVDSHCGIHTRREDIFDMTVGLAGEYGLAMRVSEPPLIEKIKGQGLPAHDYDILDSYRVETHEKPAYYFKGLRELRPGLTEWAVHPSLVTGELKAMGNDWPVRQADFEFLMSPETRAIIEQEGIIVLNYKPLQELWQAQRRQ
ncbi:MAG: carbohydrate deacetylase [Chloroflexota bacterium]|nr:MAG: carbohydrate deacetylase [Chloroflexota bacterium]